MCGIIAYTGNQNAAPILTASLRQLEYRGYDSSGIALVSRGKLKTYRAAGKLAQLENRLPNKISGKIGIGHTRWATHGEPNDQNAHPHTDTQGRISIIHNGIIENATELKRKLEAQGCVYTSETDSETIAHLISHSIISNPKMAFLDVVRLALKQLQGTYGLVVMNADAPETLIAARSGSPVIIGIGKDEMFVASDSAALSRYTREVVHLDDGEIASINAKGFEVTTLDAISMSKQSVMVDSSQLNYELGNYDNYMFKEIHEQPESIRRTLSGRLDHRFNTAHLGGLNMSPRDLMNVRRVCILGCGSAYYAGISGADMIETLARLPSKAEPAAEFRYRNPVIEPDTLYIVVSQSGETFDTLAALREIKRKGSHVLGVNNVVGSTIAREVDGGIYMHAGTEVSVASTKAYTSMLTCFALLALHLGRVRDLSPQQGEQLVNALEALPEKIKVALEQNQQIKQLAKKYHHINSAFFIGRTNAYPIALEGAQKLKEISYIHAEAYPASELKHGPLALISPQTPTIIILPDNDLLGKSISSLQEIRARKGPVIALTNAQNEDIHSLADDVMYTPNTHPILHPIIMGIPLQLFAYHCAIAMDRDIDQPRNLAKSVTVE
ncbi:MAG: glutamine--fructose-6-phosphate transaminase (isomerizing) [Gammaproteobacteria bacterium]|nr:glutamine--fructose-6-phosphate transaminase (isomerizing) [Gammaproteobacteria bacterium]